MSLGLVPGYLECLLQKFGQLLDYTRFGLSARTNFCSTEPRRYLTKRYNFFTYVRIDTRDEKWTEYTCRVFVRRQSVCVHTRGFILNRSMSIPKSRRHAGCRNKERIKNKKNLGQINNGRKVTPHSRCPRQKWNNKKTQDRSRTLDINAGEILRRTEATTKKIIRRVEGGSAPRNKEIPPPN